MSINLPRDRELADTLYALVEQAEQLKLDLNLLVHGLQEAHHTETGLAVVGGKSITDVALDHTDPAHAKRKDMQAILHMRIKLWQKPIWSNKKLNRSSNCSCSTIQTRPAS